VPSAAVRAIMPRLMPPSVHHSYLSPATLTTSRVACFASEVFVVGIRMLDVRPAAASR